MSAQRFLPVTATSTYRLTQVTMCMGGGHTACERGGFPSGRASEAVLRRSTVLPLGRSVWKMDPQRARYKYSVSHAHCAARQGMFPNHRIIVQTKRS